MKKLLLSIVTLLVFYKTSTAQCPGCIIDLNCTVSPAAPALCPAILPDGLQNTPYDENVTFYMPEQFVASGFNVTLNQITVTSITGMPQGLNWQTSASPSNIFYPSSNPPTTERGCVKICGTPTVFGQFNIIVSVVAEVSTPIGNVTQNESFSLPILITSPPGANSSFAYNPSLGCAPLDVDLNLSFLFNKKVAAGASYRLGGNGSGESIDFLVFFQLSEQLGLGAAYDFTLSDLKEQQSGSIEVMLRYDLKTDKKVDMTNPRFFF